MPTPLRNIRVPDDLWQQAKEKAEKDGTNLTEVLVAALARYVRSPHS